MERLQNQASKPMPVQEDKVDLSRFALLGGLNLKPQEIRDQLAEARAPESKQHLKQRIVDVARAFSRNYKIKVLPSSEKRWSLGIDKEAEAAVKDLDEGKRDTILDIDAKKFRPAAILYNIDDLALAPEEYLFRRLRHEATRASEGDIRYLFEGFKQAEKQMQSGVGFGLLHTTCEEARIFQREIGASSSALDSLRTSMQGRLLEIRNRINQQPLLEQLCLNLLYGVWLQGINLPEVKDSRVLEATQRIKPAFERYVLSNDHAENLAIVERELWPEAQKLDAQSVGDEMERLAAVQLSQVAEHERKFQKRLWNKVVNGVRRLAFMKPRQFRASEEGKELFQASEASGGPLLRADLKKNLEMQRSDSALLEGHLPAQGSESMGLRQDIDLSRLDQYRPALRQVLKNLNPIELAKLEEESRAKIRANQGELLRRQLPIGVELRPQPKEKNESHLDLSQVPSKDELKAQEDAIKELLRDPAYNGGGSGRGPDTPDPGARSAAIQQELRRRELSREGFSAEELQLYENFKALERSVIHRIDDFLEELRPLLPKLRAHAIGKDLHYTGTRLNKRAVVRRAAVNDGQVWNRRVGVDTPDPRMFVTLLIDNSPSMEGAKIVEARKTAMFWARALKELKIPFAIKYFGGTTHDLKGFEHDYDDPACRVKQKIISNLDASTGYTNLEQPLQRAATEMAKQQRRLRDFFGAIFVISDGGANRGLQGEALRDYIKALRQKYVVMNFMLATSGQEITDARFYFGGTQCGSPTVVRETARRVSPDLTKRAQRGFTKKWRSKVCKR